jgi:hypothetical protein
MLNFFNHKIDFYNNISKILLNSNYENNKLIIE